MLGAEGARFAQANPGFDARGAGVLNGQRIDGGLEGIVQDFADFRLGQIAEHDRIFEVHRRVRRTDVRA